MKKYLIAALALGPIAGIAHADDGNSVTLYGILDVAVGVVEHSANGSPYFPATVNPVSKVSTKFQRPVWGMFNGGISDSRWGIRGNENLGGGMSAFFDLESGINVPSGNLNNAAGSIAGSNNTVGAASALNGQLFNRGAYVGLKQDAYGALSFGRSTTLGFDTIVNYDPMLAAQLFSPLGFSGSYSAGGITEGSRTDNNVKYTNHVGPVNFGISYSFGGVAGKFGDGSTFGANLGYEANGFGLQATWYEARDAVHSGALTGANAVGGAGIGTNAGTLTLDDDEDFMIAAKYAYGPFTVKGGYEHYELKAPTDPVGAGTTVNYYGYTGSLANAVYTSKNNLYFFGGDYKITPVFDVALGFYDTQTMQSTGVAGGNQLQYSVLADYHLSKRTDVYAGYMFSKFNGAAFNGYQSTNYIAAAGMRTLF
ncbi:porin [Paraburkholderia ferrariae]|uniref:porin n=1 Tax=Paraburkholderia ferrariae TaxID=386056 RepID=UPI0004843C90|nr:porin [Paraburkholderia ferrariae]